MNHGFFLTHQDTPFALGPPQPRQNAGFGSDRLDDDGTATQKGDTSFCADLFSGFSFYGKGTERRGVKQAEWEGLFFVGRNSFRPLIDLVFVASEQSGKKMDSQW